MDDLLKYLNETPGATAYLDVFEEEPYNDKTAQLPNLFKSSHIAGVYKNIDQEIIGFTQTVIQNFVNL